MKTYAAWVTFGARQYQVPEHSEYAFNSLVKFLTTKKMVCTSLQFYNSLLVHFFILPKVCDSGVDHAHRGTNEQHVHLSYKRYISCWSMLSDDWYS